MQVLQIDESQTEFAHLLDLVQNRNETVVIEYGRHRRKVAMIVPYREEKHPRVFGPCKGKGSFRLHSDFAMDERICRIFIDCYRMGCSDRSIGGIL